jgi:hypothetical protein
MSTHRFVKSAAILSFFGVGFLLTPAGCATPEMGEQCTKYYDGCCAEAAGSNETAKSACFSAKDSIDKAIEDGKDPESFESSCATSIKTAQDGGSCLSASDKVCNTYGDQCMGCAGCDTFCPCQEQMTSGQITAASCMETCQ